MECFFARQSYELVSVDDILCFLYCFMWAERGIRNLSVVADTPNEPSGSPVADN